MCIGPRDDHLAGFNGLTQGFQHEALTHLLEVTRIGGVADVFVVTMSSHTDEVPDDGLTGLDSMQFQWIRIGLRVRVELRSFHQRCFVLWQSGYAV